MQNKQDEAECYRSMDTASAACCRLYLYFFFLKKRIMHLVYIDIMHLVKVHNR